MRFPSIAAVAAELRGINANVEGECDVRLQVWPDGEWIVRSGDSSYDQDHRGFWGASSVPGVNRGRASRFDSRSVARDLIEQARDQHASE
jgi:hypothetical protein